MSSPSPVQSYRDLKAEQRRVQDGTIRARMLNVYDSCLFPGEEFVPPRHSAVRDFCAPLALGKTVSIPSLLSGLAHASPDGKAHWVDMGAGHALAMRQVACMPALIGKVRMTKVDLEDLSLRDLSTTERRTLERTQPGMTSRRAKPATLLADATVVALPRPADLITAVEMVQYLDDPLRAICTWYNQLADNGLLLVATGVRKAYGMIYPKESDQTRPDASPRKDLFQQLGNYGIHYALTDTRDDTDGWRPPADPDKYRVMVIQKKPGTRLHLNSPVTDISPGRDDGYKVVTYQPPSDVRPLVTIATV